MILLSTAYLGNIQYFSKLVLGEQVVIDGCENYLKQSYRNRCDIVGAQGAISLSIPVYKHSGAKTATRDVCIDYSKQWQPTHWKSIVSAYRNSPYFDEYEQDFSSLYHTRTELLIDFNEQLQQVVFSILGIEPTWTYSDAYVLTDGLAGISDYRLSLSPKERLLKPDSRFECAEYYQIFSDKMPFIPNMSIIDLLFCEGADETLDILRASTLPFDKVHSDYCQK